MTAVLRDRRGAIMVLGLFMAIFATGCLFYLVELGEAIARREGMQDAADAAAFSAAVLHARGMNVIALVNMTMAALLAVLIALKLVELAGYIGVVVATGAAFITSGASLSAVPQFTQLAINAREAHDTAKPVVHTSLRALRIAARGVRIAMPWVAQARTVQTVVDHYSPPAIAGFAVPSRLTLPTRDDSYKELCSKAGEYVGDLINVPFGGISLAGFTIGDVTGGLIDQGSAWFCEVEGDGGGRPGTWVTRKIWHPVLPKARRCEELGQRPDANAAEHEQTCAEARHETIDADLAVDKVTGHCVEGTDCDLYERRAALAHIACAPRARDDDKLSEFKWQVHLFTRRYTWDEGEWKVAEELVPGTERYQLVEARTRPCGASSSPPNWSRERRSDGTLMPICHNIEPPTVPPIGSERTIAVAHFEVVQMFGCLEIKEERREVEGEGGGLTASENEAEQMAPQIIAEGAVLGEEDFQVRAVVVGSDTSASIPALSGLHSRDSDENPQRTAAWRAVSTLGRVAVAQAEYYFDASSPQAEELLWSMRWKARLRAFRLRESEPLRATPDDLADAALHDIAAVHTTFESACAALAPEDFPCGAVDLSLISGLIAH